MNKGKKGNTFAERLVRQRIAELMQAWGGNYTSKYACKCADDARRGYDLDCCTVYKSASQSPEPCACLDGETTSIACCENGNNFLPDSLTVLFDEIKAEDVVRSIIEEIDPYLKRIFTEENNLAFTKHNSKDFVRSWNWTATGKAESATKVSGLYEATEPVMKYDASEVGYPFKRARTLWQTCNGLVRQVLFTMPMAPLVVNKTSGDWMWTAASVLPLRTPKMEFDPAMHLDQRDGDGGFSSTLEKYVDMLLARSFDDSALFWHYAMRHVPSDSLMCLTNTSDNTVLGFAKGSKLQFEVEPGLAQQAPDLLLQAGSNNFSLHGYGAFAIGSARCLCGWTLLSNGACQIPADLCAQLAFQTCSYDVHDDSIAASILEVVDFTNPQQPRTWECPNLDFSDAWGIVPTAKADEWIRLSSSSLMTAKTLSASLSDVIRNGRSGLRIGNMKSMPQLARQAMHPMDRVHLLKNVPLQRCASNILSTFDAASFAQSVVDDLFPAAQAVGTESLPVSACLRFSIEYSRLRVLKMLLQGTNSSSTEIKVNLQQAVVTRWKHQCESQLGMLAVCKSNGIFEMMPDKNVHNCSFNITDEFKGQYYVGPASCLVYINSTRAFYDPCLHPAKPCAARGTSYSLQELLSTPATRLQFDARLMGNGEVLGTWPVKFYGTNEEKNQMAAAFVGMLEQFRTTGTHGVPWRMTTDFADRILGGTDTGSVGNTRHKWAQAEGFASTSTDFCDSIADWWPEVAFYSIVQR